MTTALMTARSLDVSQLIGQLGLSHSAIKADLLSLALIDISSSAVANNEKLEFLGGCGVAISGS
jgi:dsRNA-specific ribonuclease